MDCKSMDLGPLLRRLTPDANDAKSAGEMVKEILTGTQCLKHYMESIAKEAKEVERENES